MNEPIDQPDRQRFVCELDRNFSVIAAAGSGKTRAITDRIAQIAKSSRALELLPQLVVVAFTNRAADEMQQRARAEVLKARVPIEVLAALNRGFFGTIHSFSVRLLERYGHQLGLPPTFEVITDDDEIWNDFVQEQVTIGRSLSEEDRCELLRHVQARTLMELGRRCELESVDGPSGKCPDADFTAIYRHVARGAMLQTIPAYQTELEHAERRWRTTDDYVRWPVCWSKAKDFVRLKREAFAPLRRWIDQASLRVAAEVRRDYRAFRIERGLLTYNDQVALALELLKQPEIGREIREKSFRVILDETQDTDPRQFSLLLELTRPPNAKGDWLETKTDPPRAGHFCMVGDFQQSIYRDRADLSQYRRIHNTLVEAGAADALKFSVTFRLDQAQLDLVNETFRQILNDQDNQVAFVELNPRPQVLPGQIIRLDLQPANLRPDPTGKVSDRRRAAEEARQLGEWLQKVGPEKLRAQNWREVAILCPRKEWLQTLRRGLRAAGLEVQIQSEKELKGDNPAYAWLTSLLIVLSQPRCGYEIAGLLRELFGVSDHELAVFGGGFGDRFQIETFTNGGDIVSKTLRLLAETRLSILPLPLFDAVNEAVTRTQLRERLGTLPETDFEDLGGDLDALLALAAASEAERMTLAEFADVLRTHYRDAREVRPSRADSIQLITSQKAKGSEWRAVIVPFLTRDIRTPSPPYPRLLKDRATGDTIVLLEKCDMTDEINDTLELEQRQEMERLLYVALTRAQHTLVLAFDENLFAKPSGEIHSHSQSKWLKADKNEMNQAAFAAMATQPAACAETTEHHRQKTQTGADEIDIEPLDARIEKNAALQRASIFVRTLTPSGLPAEETLLESRYVVADLPRSTSPALRYGLWWHQFAQKLEWRGAVDDWSKIFERHERISPEQARSRREWKLLLNHISSADDFRRVCSANGFAHSEMPLFWKTKANRCLEGVIDLAFFDPVKRKCLILDWKTDRVPPDSTETLHDRYLPQLAAYWKAVSELTKMDVVTAIYSTAAGALVRYQPAELDRAWQRLEKLPPDEFDSKIKRNVDPPTEKPNGPATQLEFPEL